MPLTGQKQSFSIYGLCLTNKSYYEGLHFQPVLPGAFGGGREERSAPYIYWFLVACHEYAHNFVSDHNSEHEFYLSSYAETFMSKLVLTLQQEGVQF